MTRFESLDVKRLLAVAALSVSAALAATPSHAALFTYTLDGGAYTGTIGLDSFTNASLVVTMTADSDSKVSGSLTFPPYTVPYWIIYGTPTFTITQGPTSWSGSLLTTAGNPFGVISGDLSAFGGSIKNFGFVAMGPSTSFGVGLISDLDPNFYDLSSVYSISGIPSAANLPLTTSIGSLTFSLVEGGPATFTVTAASGVPLPMTLALVLGGLGVLGGARRVSE